MGIQFRETNEEGKRRMRERERKLSRMDLYEKSKA